MEAATAIGAGPTRAPTPDLAFLAEPGPGFIDPEMHAKTLDTLRAQAQEAADFHMRKLDDARTIISSCDNALATLAEAKQAARH